MFENYENISGIYCITNLHNNKKYIGKTKDMKKRFNQHLGNLNKNHKDHQNEHIQNAWNKYGEKRFIFQALYVMDNYTDEEANSLEILFIKLLKTTNRLYGYNKTFGGDGGDTFSLLSDEQKEKRNKLLSEAVKGREISEETRRLLSESKKGKNNPNFGKATWNKGIKYSDEVRQQMSERMKGKVAGEKNPMKKPEVVEKITGQNNYKYRHDLDDNMSDIINELYNGTSLRNLSNQYNVDPRTLRNRLDKHIPEDELKDMIEINRSKALSKARKGKKSTNYDNEQKAEKIIKEYRKTMCKKNKNGMCFLKVKKCRECARGFYFQYSFTDIKTKKNININNVSLKQLLKDVIKKGYFPIIVDGEKFSNVIKLDNDLITFTEFKEIVN